MMYTCDKYRDDFSLRIRSIDTQSRSYIYDPRGPLGDRGTTQSS